MTNWQCFPAFFYVSLALVTSRTNPAISAGTNRQPTFPVIYCSPSSLKCSTFTRKCTRHGAHSRGRLSCAPAVPALRPPPRPPPRAPAVPPPRAASVRPRGRLGARLLRAAATLEPPHIWMKSGPRPGRRPASPHPLDFLM